MLARPLALAALTFALALPLAAGCASHEMYDHRPAQAAPVGPALTPAVAGAVDSALAVRLLVKSASLDLEADDLREIAREAERIGAAAGGYVQSSYTADERRLSVTLRVPADRVDGVLAQLEKLGQVTRRSVSSDDVTEQAVDLDARLKNLIAVRDRMKHHLDETRTIAEVIQLENTLAQVQGEIDALDARLKHLRSTAALSQIALSVERPRILGPVGYASYGLWWVVSRLFVIR